VIPYSNKKEDEEAAKRLDILLNRLFIEPTLGRNYPNEDFALIDKLHLKTKAWRYTERMQFDFDFIGLQNYFSVTVKHNALIPYVQASEVTAKARKAPHTAMGWEISPDSFYRLLKRYWNYGSVKSIIVTENGACFKDTLKNGNIHDAERINYFKQYLAAVYKAKQEGVKINGYLAWTLMDNFEWSEGFNARFGLIHVDFKTQLRTIKDSGYWWRDFLLNK
jgi:beta-glucosidase